MEHEIQLSQTWEIVGRISKTGMYTFKGLLTVLGLRKVQTKVKPLYQLTTFQCLSQFVEALEEVRQNSNGRMFLQIKTERSVNNHTLSLPCLIVSVELSGSQYQCPHRKVAEE